MCCWLFCFREHDINEVSVFITGFFTGAGLIIAIGAQNAFVLSQGIRKQYVGLVSFTCAIIDILLICAGVAGMGRLINDNPTFVLIATIGGAAFLAIYALLAFRSAAKGKTLQRDKRTVNSATKAFIVTISLSFLNPHVYLDTVVLLGSIGSQYGTYLNWWFALGASVASVLWFFSLGYGAGKLAPWFENPRSWLILDILIGLVMTGIAFTLLLSGIEQWHDF